MPLHDSGRASLARCGAGVDWFEELTAAGAFLLRTCGRRRLPFPPCEGGVGRRTSASSVYPPFARKYVRKRHALQAGEAAHALSNSSINRAKHTSVVLSRLTGPPPPGPPLHKGGKEAGTLAEFAYEFGAGPLGAGPEKTRALR